MTVEDPQLISKPESDNESDDESQASEASQRSVASRASQISRSSQASATSRQTSASSTSLASTSSNVSLASRTSTVSLASRSSKASLASRTPKASLASRYSKASLASRYSKESLASRLSKTSVKSKDSKTSTVSLASKDSKRSKASVASSVSHLSKASGHGAGKVAKPGEGSGGGGGGGGGGEIAEEGTDAPGEAGNVQDRKNNASRDSPQRQTKAQSGDGRSKQREFFKSELHRLETRLRREASKIHAPPRRQFAPFVFNSLEPYFNTHTTKYLIELPEMRQHVHVFSARSTAQGLTDPWEDLRMDRDYLPHIIVASPSSANGEHPKTAGPRARGKTSVKAADIPRHEGSTHLPKFPVVALETKDLATRQLYYSDVPMLRKELKSKYSSQARSKIDADYKRTKQDFYRMDLDRLDQVAPGSRRHLTSTYLAYLQNTPGSRRAVVECVKTLQEKVQ